MVSDTAERQTTSTTDSLRLERTRTSTAWIAAGAALAAALCMLIFILQNSQSIQMDFLWVDFSLPLGVTVLLSMVIGGLLVVAIGTARVLQLRLAARRHRTDHRRR